MVVLVAFAVALVLIGIPVAFVIGLISCAAFWLQDTSFLIVPQQSFQGLYNFILLTIPFFIFTGVVMDVGGASARLIRFASVLVGWMRGGLGMADIVSSVLFADISGSATADTAAIGSVMIPGLLKRGYRVEFATALQSAAGSLGLLFPPATSMIVYAYVANVSVGKMFLASFIPGLFVALSFMAVNYVAAVRRGYPAEPFPTASEVFRAFKDAFFDLMAPAIILGGILGGVFTPTEAGAVAATYVLILTTFFYRTMTLQKLWQVLNRTISTTARVTLLLSMALLLGLFLIRAQVPQIIAESLGPIAGNPLLLIFVINIVLVVLHVGLETIAAILVVVPVLLPLLQEAHIDPVHFGIIVLINSAIGINLPPIGFCLYISCALTGVSIERAAIAILPFIGALVVDLFLVSVFPEFALFMPRLLGVR